MSVHGNVGTGEQTKGKESGMTVVDEEKYRLFNLRIKALRNEEPLSSGSGFSSSAYSTEDEDGEGERQDFPKEDYLGEFVEPDDVTVQKIIAQVEYYFSDAHVHRDSFMQKHIRRGAEGFISIKLLACFRKVKTLTKDYRVVAYSLRRSKNLEVNKLGSKVKRVVPFPKDLPERGVQVVLLVGVDARRGEGVVEGWVRRLFGLFFREGAGRNDGGMDGRGADGEMNKMYKSDDINNNSISTERQRGGVDDDTKSSDDSKTNDNGGDNGGFKIDENNNNNNDNITTQASQQPIISDVRILTEWKYIPKLYRDTHAHLFTFHNHLCSVLVDLFYPSHLDITAANHILRTCPLDVLLDGSGMSEGEKGWRGGVVLHQLPCPKSIPVHSRRKAKTSKTKTSDKISCEGGDGGKDKGEKVGGRDDDGWRGASKSSWRSHDSPRSSPLAIRKSSISHQTSPKNSPPAFTHTHKSHHHKSLDRENWRDDSSPNSSNPNYNATPNTFSPGTMPQKASTSPSPWSSPSSSPQNSPSSPRRRSKLGPSPLLNEGSGGESPRSSSPWIRNKLLAANNSFSPGTSPLAGRKFAGKEEGVTDVVKVTRLPRGPDDVARGFTLVRSHQTTRDFNNNNNNNNNNTVEISNQMQANNIGVTTTNNK